MEWDAGLLHAWRKDWLMGPLTAGFIKKHGLALDQFKALHRTPVRNQFKMPVRAFVASGLPALSERLWRGDDGPDLLDFMEGLRTGRPGRSKTMAPIRNEERRQARTKRVDIHAGHRRSDWHVIK